MNIYQLLLYKNPQIIQDLDDYQVLKHKRHIEVLKEEEEEERGWSANCQMETGDELVKLMKKPTRWKRRPK